MNIFKCRLKVLLRDKETLFWTIIFPLGLAIFFYMGFGTIDFYDTVSTSDLYIVKEKEHYVGDLLDTTLDSLNYDEDTKMFKLSYIETLEEACTSYIDGNIDNYLYLDGNDIKLETKNERTLTLVKTVVSEYKSIEYFVNAKIKDGNTDIDAIINDYINSSKSLIEVKSTVENTSFATVYFYALVAMICLYAALIGLRVVMDVRADNSDIGIRAGVTPTSRSKLLAIYFLVGFLFEMAGTAILILFIKFVLRIEFGNLGFTLIAAWLGDIVGLTFGMMCGCVSKISRGAKEGLINAVALLSCFLAGLMVYSIKHILDTSLGIFAKLNPATPIADSFFSLYFYSDYKNYLIDLGFMGGLSLVFFGVVLIKMRSEKYESL